MDVQQSTNDDFNPTLPTKKSSNPLLTVVLCATFVMFGVGSGLGVNYYMNSVDNAKPNKRRSSSKTKDRLEFFQWLVGGDTNNNKSKTKKKYGPFDSVFGKSYEPPEIPKYESPLTSRPTISF